MLLGACNPNLKPFRPPDAILSKETILTGTFATFHREDDARAGITICENKVSKKTFLENEIHSIAHSEKLGVTVFLPKIDSAGYAQKNQGPLVKLSPAPGHYFYGHGAIDEARKLLYTAQAPITPSTANSVRMHLDGVIHVYSLEDLQLKDQFSSFGRDPHEIRIFGDELVVCNGGKDTNVAFIDLATRKLNDSYAGAQGHVSFRHLDRFDDSTYAIGSLSRKTEKVPPLFHLNRKTGITVNQSSAQLTTKMLNMQILSILCYQDLILCTCPTADSLLIWSRSGEMVGIYPIKGASSLAYSPLHEGVLIGTSSLEEPLHLLEYIGNSIRTTRLNWGADLNGSHSLLLA